MWIANWIWKFPKVYYRVDESQEESNSANLGGVEESFAAADTDAVDIPDVSTENKEDAVVTKNLWK